MDGTKDGRTRGRGIRAVYTPLASPPGMAHATLVRRPSSRIAAVVCARRSIGIAAVACASLCLACVGAPAADPDGAPETAQTIEVAPRADALECGADAKPDCADWFRFRVAAAGTVRVSATPAAPSPAAAGASAPAPSSPAPLELAIAEAAGREVGRTKAGPGAPSAEILLTATAPTDYVAVVALPAGAGGVAYRLSFDAAAKEAAPSAAPAVRVSRWEILEVDADGAVLIDGGREDGLRAGQRGRLVDGKRTLGALVVVDVFDEGSRARIEGALSGEITADTVAEIEGPAGRR
jgi:hypothetical protein